MVTKELPGGEIYEENGGSYANEVTARRHEAIHRQLAGTAAAAASVEADRAKAEADRASAVVAAVSGDTGTLTVRLEAGFTAHSTLNNLRRVGSTVFLQLGWQGAPSANAIITKLPAWANPSTMGMTGSTLGTSVFLRASTAAPDVYGYGLKPTSTAMDYVRIVYHTARAFPTDAEIAAYRNG